MRKITGIAMMMLPARIKVGEYCQVVGSDSDGRILIAMLGIYVGGSTLQKERVRARSQEFRIQHHDCSSS